MLGVGSRAPDIEASATTGPFALSERLELGPVVLYFYPRADTPGCTVEAQEFEGWTDDFATLGASVAGCSVDSLDAQSAFASKYNLTFPLIADADGRISDAFGVLRETEVPTANRVTFVIGGDGVITRVYTEVTARGHAEEVLQDLRAASGR